MNIIDGLNNHGFFGATLTNGGNSTRLLGGSGDAAGGEGEQLAVFERQIAAGRERLASAALLSARSLSHQEELTRLKDRFRELEAHLAVQALSIQVSTESKCELTKESISSTAAINEQLNDLVTDQRNKRDQYAAVLSNHLEGNFSVVFLLVLGAMLLWIILDTS